MHGTPGEAFPEITMVEYLARGRSASGFDNVTAFLRRFGYLQDDDHAKSSTLTDEVSTALSKYQKRHALPVTGVFDEETRAQMTTSRCGLPDIRPDGPAMQFAAACAWGRLELTYAFDDGTSDIPGDGEFEAVRAAFRTWQFDTPLSFAEIIPTDSPDIMVGWRRTMDPDLDMTGAAIAHADFPPGCETLVPGLPQPLHFDNGEHTWAIGATAGAYDVETVALHEIGHLIGLGHSSDPDAVMFDSISSNFIHRVLESDDKAGAFHLYP